MSHNTPNGSRTGQFPDQKAERSPLSEMEKEILKSLRNVTFLPGSYDKRFFNSLSIDGSYTWKQKRYLQFVFNKYRRQIRNYQELALKLDPDRFTVEVKYEQDLFTVNGQATVSFKDTFKPRRLVDPNQPS